MIAYFNRFKRYGRTHYVLKTLAEVQIKMQLLAEVQIKMQLDQTKNTVAESGLRRERVLLFKKLCAVLCWNRKNVKNT